MSELLSNSKLEADQIVPEDARRLPAAANDYQQLLYSNLVLLLVNDAMNKCRLDKLPMILDYPPVQPKPQGSVIEGSEFIMDLESGAALFRRVR